MTSPIMTSVSDMSHNVVAGVSGEPSRKRKRGECFENCQCLPRMRCGPSSSGSWHLVMVLDTSSSNHSCLPSGHCSQSPTDHLSRPLPLPALCILRPLPAQPSSPSRSARSRTSSSLVQDFLQLVPACFTCLIGLTCFNYKGKE